MSGDVLLTANFGQYDNLLPVPEIEGVTAICFTDDRDLSVSGWTMKVSTPLTGEHPRMSAKWFKTHPYFAEGYRTLWMDASHHLVHAAAVQAALDCIGDSGIALHEHPSADRCIYAEARRAIPMRKYQDQPIAEQAEHYRKEGHPEGWGLWACGTMATERGRADDLLEEWWDECVRWTYQDQISFPVVMRRNDMRPERFPHNQYQSPWFSIGGHRRDD